MPVTHAQTTLEGDRIVAFRYLRPLSAAHIKRVLHAGDLHRREMMWMPTKDASLKVGLSKSKSNFEFWIYFEDQCVGNVLFFESYLKGFPGFKSAKVFEPHSVLSPLVQKLGYVSWLYTLVLERGYALATKTHTKEAAQLWNSLSRKYSLWDWDEDENMRLNQPTADSWKVLFKKK